MKIIAVSGWKGSGKDTVAQYMIEKLNFKRHAFADVLKEMVANQYNIPLDWLHNPELKEKPLSQYPVSTEDKFGEVIHSFMNGEFKTLTVGGNTFRCWTPRALAILEGSAKRSVNSQYWVQKVVDDINKDFLDGFRDRAVITDMRYKSEADQLKKEFGSRLMTVRVNRFDECDSVDPSERDLDDYEFDAVIENRSTLDDLYNSVVSLVNQNN